MVNGTADTNRMQEQRHFLDTRFQSLLPGDSMISKSRQIPYSSTYWACSRVSGLPDTLSSGVTTNATRAIRLTL